MAPVTTRRSADEEEEYLESEAEELAEEAEAAAPAPAVSDSRRRRQLKRGGGIMAYDEPAAGASSAVTEKKGRPTPSQREEAAPSRNPITRFVNNLREYWRDTRAELQKVAWPSRDDIRRLTYIVLAVTFASSVFLGVVSLLFSALVTQMAAESGALAGIVGVVLIVIVSGLWFFRDRFFPTRSE